VANKIDMKDLAARGAAVRIAELEAEIASIRVAFPRLRGTSGAGTSRGRRGRSRGAASPTANDEGKPRRRRRAMSAQERKAVSLRMKKYWAARRAGK